MTIVEAKLLILNTEEDIADLRDELWAVLDLIREAEKKSKSKTREYPQLKRLIRAVTYTTD